MTLSPLHVAILEAQGWTVVCESPFEISNEESESIATGYAAQLVVESVLSSSARSTSGIDIANFNVQPSDKSDTVHQIVDLAAQLDFIVNRAIFQSTLSYNNSEIVSKIWKSTYDKVFSAEGSSTLLPLLRLISLELGLTPFTWADPDSGYSDDVMAYHSAVSDFVSQVLVKFQYCPDLP